MREAREEQGAQRSERRKAIRDLEQNKLDAGARMVAKATSCGKVILSDDDLGEVSESKGDYVWISGFVGGPRKKKRCITNHRQLYEGEMERFGSLLKDSAKVQCLLEGENLSL